MKRNIKSDASVWEGLIAIIVGLLFVIWPGSILKWIVLFTGIVSLVAGAIQLIVYWANRRKPETERTALPLLGLLILIWGILLLVQPEVWVNLFMVVMSIPMILLSIGQMVMLGRRRRAGITVRWGYYIFPVLFLLAGITVLFNPFASALWLVFFAGVWIIAYGISEMVNAFALRR